MYDIGIIGGGPAALSAAVSARQRNKSVCIFGRSLDSSLLFAAEKVDNYLGLPDLSGEELLNQFYAHQKAGRGVCGIAHQADYAHGRVFCYQCG